jgi:hypothetical protein
LTPIGAVCQVADFLADFLADFWEWERPRGRRKIVAVGLLGICLPPMIWKVAPFVVEWSGLRTLRRRSHDLAGLTFF